jgi:hypothetical protein
MSAPRALVRVGLFYVGLQFFYVGLVSAQVDPKVLIGTWEGKAQNVPGQDERTIIIRSVKRTDEGTWVAVGNYGITGGKLPRNTFDVSLRNEELVLNFVTGGKNPAQLVLKGDNRLEGKLELALSTRSGSVKLVNAPLTLEKVSTKTEVTKE